MNGWRKESTRLQSVRVRVGLEKNCKHSEGPPLLPLQPSWDSKNKTINWKPEQYGIIQQRKFLLNILLWLGTSLIPRDPPLPGRSRPDTHTARHQNYLLYRYSFHLNFFYINTLLTVEDLPHGLWGSPSQPEPRHTCSAASGI